MNHTQVELGTFSSLNTIDTTAHDNKLIMKYIFHGSKKQNDSKD